MPDHLPSPAGRRPDPPAGEGRGPTRLVRRYGTLAPDVVALAEADPGLAEPVAPGCPTIGAELAYAVTHEGALTVEDLIERRTRISFVDADVAPATAAAERLLSLVS